MTTSNRIFAYFRIIIFSTLVFVLATMIYTATHIREEEYFKFDADVQPSSPEHLRKYGFSIYNALFSIPEIEILKNHCKDKNYKTMKTYLLQIEKLNDFVEKTTNSPDYVFQDYIWIIEKSSVHTCHRDNNGDFFNEGQQHPSYTMIIYLEDMNKCLAIIPSSHENIYSYYTNLNKVLQNIRCNKGDVIIFNANLIHAGTITEKENNMRIQLKVTHKDDIQHLQYYQDYNKVLDKENTHSNYVRRIQQNVSCMFPLMANLTQKENIRTARGSQYGITIGIPQKIFSYVFYGDKDYYDLPNAF